MQAGSWLVAAPVSALLATVMCWPAQAANTWDGGAGTGNWNDALNWDNDLVPTGTPSLTFAGGVQTSTTNNSGLTGVNGLTFAANAGSFVLAGNGLTLSGNVANNSTSTQTITLNLATTATRTFTMKAGGGNIVIGDAFDATKGVISGTGGGITTAGTGSRTLWGNNSYTGTTTVANNTTLNINTSSAIGNSTLSLTGGANSAINNTSGAAITLSTNNAVSFSVFSFGGTNDLNLGTGAVNNNSNGSIVTLNGTNSKLTFGGIVPTNSAAANNTLTVMGAGNTLVLGGYNLNTGTASGTLSIRGDANLQITGAVANGTPTSGNPNFTWAGTGRLTLSGANSFTGSFSINGGTATLDYANVDTVLGANNAVVLSGGTLEFKGRTGANTTAQTIGAISFGGNTGLSTIVANRNGGTSETITAGSIAALSGSFLLIDESSGGTFTAANAAVNGIIRTQVLVNDSTGRVDWAANSGANTATTALNASTNLVATGGSAGTNYKLDGSQTLTGATTGQTLRINTTGAGQSLNLGANNLAANILFVGSDDYTINSTTGALSRDTGTDSNGIIADFGTGKLTIAALLGKGAGTNTLVGNGSNLIELNAASNNTAGAVIGNVTVRNTSGILNTNATTGSGSGFVAIASRGILELTGNFSRDLGTSGAGKVGFTATSTVGGSGGFSAFGGDRTVSLSSGTAITWSSTAGFLGDGSTLILGSGFNDSTVDFQNAIAFGALNRTVEAVNGSAAMDGKLSGVLSGAGGLTKTGAGTLALTNANAYTGRTEVDGGTLRISGSVASSNVIVTGSTTLQLDSNASLDDGSTLTLNSGSMLNLNFTTGNESIGQLIINGTLFSSPIVFNADNNYNGYGSYFTSSGGGLQVVPEPASLSLLLGTGGLLIRRRRKC